ncbi:hypothetical protein [Blastococcus sp. SYSU D00820]
MRRAAVVAATAATLLGAGLVVAPAASAAPASGGACPRGAQSDRAEWGASWTRYPATDPIPGYDRGQLVDRNGNGWVCAWTPRGLFDPTQTSPWVVVDDSVPAR